LDDAAAHDRTGDVAELGGAEDLADLRRAELDLLVLRLEHALEGGLDLVDRVVDDRVVLDLDALALGVVRVQTLRADVVADDDGVRGDREVDVVHRDRADAAVDDAQVHALADLDAQQRLLEGLHRTGGVALEDEVEGLDLALGHVLVDVLEADALAHLRERRGTLGGLALLSDLAGGALVLGDQEGVTGAGHRGQTEHLHRAGRTRLGDGLAVLVEHRTDAAVAAAADDRVADPQGALLDQHGGDRAAALVEVRLDGHAARVLVRVRGELEGGVRREQHRLQQRIDVEVLARGDVHEHRVAAVLLGDQVVLGQLLPDLLRIGLGLVDLVDRDHDRDLRRLGVVERLDRLGHHAVVRRDHQDRDVGDVRTACTHGGERLVTRGVDEGQRTVLLLVLDLHLVGVDVLGDAAGLPGADLRLPDRVQQAGLAVVDVAHDGHDGRTRQAVLVVLLGQLGVEIDVELLQQLALLVLRGDDLDLVAQLLAQQAEGVLVQRLGRGGHLAHREHDGDQRGGVDVDAIGEVGQRGTAAQTDGLAVAARDRDAARRGGLLLLELLTLRALRLARTGRLAAATECALGAAAATATAGAAAG